MGWWVCVCIFFPWNNLTIFSHLLVDLLWKFHQGLGEVIPTVGDCWSLLNSFKVRVETRIASPCYTPNNQGLRLIKTAQLTSFVKVLVNAYLFNRTIRTNAYDFWWPGKAEKNDEITGNLPFGLRSCDVTIIWPIPKLLIIWNFVVRPCDWQWQLLHSDNDVVRTLSKETLLVNSRLNGPPFNSKRK